MSHHVMKDLEYHGMQTPMPIQSQAIPVLLGGRDLIGQAKTGTGKTLAFAIPIIEKVDTSRRVVQAMVILPTRELAEQVNGEIQKLGYQKRVSVVSVYGGKSISNQASLISRGAQVVVGTPGRIIDLIERRMLRLDQVHTLVLDEADRMLDMGFIDDIRTIISHIPTERQTMMFSATMPEEICELANTIMRDPERIMVSADELTVDETEQCYYEVPKADKFDTFIDVMRKEQPQSAIIFCNTKRWADTLEKLMNRRGFKAEALHGDLSQNQRDRVMEGFRRGKVKYLIATDVASRGLDISDISHIINYDLPRERESYVHRIGRTGRAGKSGKAITFISPQEIHDLWGIEHFCRTKIAHANPKT